MSNRTISLRHCGVPMTVTYTFYKGCEASLEGPAEEKNYTISSVKIGGVECFTLFGDEEFEDLATALDEERQAEADEYADQQRREQRLRGS